MKPRPRIYDPFAAANTLQSAYGPRTVTAANDPTRPPMPMIEGRSVLEDRYPGMAHAITLLWGHPEMNAYFDRLWLADERSAPIEPDAMSELMFLAQIHQWIVPRKAQSDMGSMYGAAYKNVEPPRRRDPWAEVDRSRRR